jgi:hypothetical protein
MKVIPPVCGIYFLITIHYMGKRPGNAQVCFITPLNVSGLPYPKVFRALYGGCDLHGTGPV